MSGESGSLEVSRGGGADWCAAPSASSRGEPMLRCRWRCGTCVSRLTPSNRAQSATEARLTIAVEMSAPTPSYVFQAVCRPTASRNAPASLASARGRQCSVLAFQSAAPVRPGPGHMRCRAEEAPLQEHAVHVLDLLMGADERHGAVAE